MGFVRDFGPIVMVTGGSVLSQLPVNGPMELDMTFSLYLYCQWNINGPVLNGLWRKAPLVIQSVMISPQESFILNYFDSSQFACFMTHKL